MKIAFTSGTSIGVYENGRLTQHESDVFNRYISVSIRESEKDKWKYSGFGAQFRGDAIEKLRYDQSNEKILGETTSVSFINENTVNYSVFVNNLSAVCTKDLSAEKDSEGHIIHATDRIFKGSSEQNGKLALSVSDDGITAHIAIFNKNTDDYSLVTDGDSLDFDPAYSERENGKILFASKGAGRDGDGNFIEYSPSYILSYDEFTGNIEEELSDPAYSFIKPKEDENGNLYAIKKPVKDKRKSNLLLDIILIPWRLLTAIYYFLESFTRAFTGKNFTDKSPNPAKNNKKSSREIFIDGNLIYADEELKKNIKHKDDFAGIIPRSYELIKRSPDGKVTTVKKGVIAYAPLKDGSVIAGNGKYLLKISADGVTEKICEAPLTTEISVIE